MSSILKDKRAVITGGGDGIGRTAVTLFAENGARVVSLEINEEKAKAAEAEERAKGHDVTFLICDISDLAQVEAAFARVEEMWGSLDILYNNASVFLGQGRDNRVTKLDPAIWDRVLKINLYGLYHCSRCAIPLMKKAGGGSIVNTASSAGVIGIPDCDAYTATKGATVSMTRSMAVEYGPDGIRVNCIAPAAIATPMVYQSNLSDPNFDEHFFLTKGTPLRRWGQPVEVAKAAMFFASDLSSYINGAVMTADGGITVS